MTKGIPPSDENDDIFAIVGGVQTMMDEAVVAPSLSIRANLDKERLMIGSGAV